MSFKLPSGFSFYSASAGLKEEGRPDILLIKCENGCTATAVFTTNRLSAAPVKISKMLLSKEKIFSGVFVNTGYANAATGRKGLEDAQEMISYVRSFFNLPYSVLPASTGVIGAYLPVEKIKEALKKAEKHTDIELAARSIMTTDTYPKFKVLSGSGYLVAGISKGAGMIAPSMATTLTFVLTDANFSLSFLNSALKKAVEKTFNRISVDGEQSTNDSIYLLSSGKKEVGKREEREFELLLTDLLFDLAMKILKDGEGATKVIKVVAEGFRNKKEALKAARRIALSPLVKTAVYGCDPNWGRVFSALGDAEVYVDEEKLAIYFGPYLVYDGRPVDFKQDEVRDYLKSGEIEITVNARVGKYDSYFYTCDLTEKYVEINAKYTT